MRLRFLVIVSSIIVAAAAASCGGGGESSQSTDSGIVWRHGAPDYVVTHAPLPKKLVVEDLRMGTGRRLEKGDTMTVRFRSFDYGTGQHYEDWWAQPFVTPFGKGDSLGAWETGLRGMKVGGRRVLIVPPAQAYTHVPVIYVLELVKVT